MFFIYALHEPDTLELRYVGRTSSPNPFDRFIGHIKGAYIRELPSSKWIDELLRQGKIPAFNILQIFYDFKSMCMAEAYWIDYFRNAGCRLVNVRPGDSCRKLQTLRKRQNGKQYQKKKKIRRITNRCPNRKPHQYDYIFEKQIFKSSHEIAKRLNLNKDEYKQMLKSLSDGTGYHRLEIEDDKDIVIFRRNRKTKEPA